MKRLEFTSYTTANPFKRLAWIWLVCGLIIGAMVGLNVGWHTRQHTRTVLVQRSGLPTGCDRQLLIHDYDTVVRANDLLLGHEYRRGFDELGRNFAAGVQPCLALTP